MNKHYRSIIFTDHALDRLDSRSISQEVVNQVVTNPYKKHQNGDTTKFIKKVHDRNIHVVAQYLSEERKWLVISVWVRGEEDKNPLAWRIITFPFWLVWKLTSSIVKLFFGAKSARNT